MKTIILFCALLCGCSYNTTSVLIIGDSISIGYTPIIQEEHPYWIVEHNTGNAKSSDNARDKLDEWLSTAGYTDIIHFNVGIWDIHSITSGSSTPIEEYRSNLEAIADRLDKTGSKIIWATITPSPEVMGRWPNEKVIEYNKVLVSVAKEHGYQIDDLYTYMLPYQYLHIKELPDVHYTDEGWQLLSYKVSLSIEGI